MRAIDAAAALIMLIIARLRHADAAVERYFREARYAVDALRHAAALLMLLLICAPRAFDARCCQDAMRC